MTNEAKWLWYDSQKSAWQPVEDSQDMEKEYQLYVETKKDCTRYFSGFGGHDIVTLSFALMRTECGSGKCWQHHGHSIADNHLSFSLRREV